MALTIQELIEDITPAIALVGAVEKAIASLPPKEQRNAAAYAKAFGAVDDSPLALTAALIDKVEGQVKS